MKQQRINKLFGTDGVREKVGKSLLTNENLPKLGYAVGQQIIEKHGPHASVLFGHDTRISSSFIKTTLQSGLLLHPLTVVDAGVLPTPAVCRLVHQNKTFKAGIIITASHNKYHDNGIKIVDDQGAKNKEYTCAIEQFFSTVPETYDYSSLGNLNIWPEGADQYTSNLCSLFPPQFLKKSTIVIDCANGAFSHIAPQVFEKLGATVIPIHNNPNGTNINDNCGSLHPADLIASIQKNNANIGFGFDGDGDRIIVITKDGIQKDGDDILALLLQHPHYTNQQAVVGTIVSNEGLATWLATQNKELIRAGVGEPLVVEQLKQHKLVLGGEPSGHIILNNYLGSSDALFTALRLCEVIIQTDNWNCTTFDRYPQISLTIPVSNKIPLDQQPLARIIAQADSQLPHGRLIVRYSGTENILRITTEDKNKEQAHHVAHTLAEKVKQELSS